MKRRPLLALLQDRFREYSKEDLYARVLCGDVFAAGERVREPARKVPVDTVLEIRDTEGSGGRFVSRGGDKLDHAISLWQLPVAGCCFIDAGASTGGFTDCLLQRGAAVVHAVDVGYNQLDYRLRSDSRVQVHERTNIMEVNAAFFSPPADAAVADLSFRSLAGAAAHLLSLTREGWIVALAKPQFETRGTVASFHGIVEDDAAIRRILATLWEELLREGAGVREITPSPLRGRGGNREFLLWLVSGEVDRTEAERHRMIDSAVAESRSARRG